MLNPKDGSRIIGFLYTLIGLIVLFAPEILSVELYETARFASGTIVMILAAFLALFGVLPASRLERIVFYGGAIGSALVLFLAGSDSFALYGSGFALFTSGFALVVLNPRNG